MVMSSMTSENIHLSDKKNNDLLVLIFNNKKLTMSQGA